MVHNLKKLKDQKIKIFLKDSRTYTGKLLTFDENMNIIMSDTEEYRPYKNKKGGASRSIGLCMFRGGNITCVEHLKTKIVEK